MRYRDTGNVHLDFHGAVNTTVNYIVKNFGIEALHEIFFRTGRDVYKSIRENLSRGDYSELVEHWAYYFDREKGKYRIIREKDRVILHVDECPAVRQVKRLGLDLSPHFCDQTEHVNRGMCHNTGFEMETVKTGECSCIQTLRRTKHDTK
ncbi:MAG: hypothetical protein WCS96_07020 [Victivallales bacterium]|jgi:hypothetical protein